MKTLVYKKYYSQRRKIANACGRHRQEKALPEINHESDAIKICCSICNKPVMNVRYYASKEQREEGGE